MKSHSESTIPEKSHLLTGVNGNNFFRVTTVGKRNYFTRLIPYQGCPMVVLEQISRSAELRNLLCWFQDIKIPTSRLVVKYGIGIYKMSREVWNSSLSLHRYCFGCSIQQLQEVREVGFRSP